jgi:hypothetical protein
MPPRGRPLSGSQNSSGRDRIFQLFVQAIRHTPRGTRTHHTPPVANHETHPKMSNSKIPRRLIKVLSLPISFPTSDYNVETLSPQ